MRTIASISIISLCTWLVFFASCKKDDVPESSIAITSMEPSAAFAEETVTIQGKGFSTNASENHVYFNNVEAVVNGATASSLTVIVPQGATTGKVKVEVNGVFATSPADFEIKQPTGQPPVISSFTPESAPAGTAITITGEHFSTVAEQNMVLINEKAATVSAASANSLKVLVPDGAVTGKISVTVEGRKVLSEKMFVVEDLSAAAPVLTAFSPQEGVAGDVITLQGDHFSSLREANNVKVNGQLAPVVFANEKTLRISIPEAATTGKITVKVNGREVNSAQDLTVFQMPVITSFSPGSGGPGTVITILGNNFGYSPALNKVYVHHTAATVTFANTSMLKVTVPAEAATGRISVTANGMTTRSQQDFEVTNPCPAPQELSAWSFILQRGETTLLIAKCSSPVAAENLITFAGGATTYPTRVQDASASMGEPNWYFLTVTVPAAAQSGYITLTVNGNSIQSTDPFTITD